VTLARHGIGSFAVALKPEQSLGRWYLPRPIFLSEYDKKWILL
jgi:hypothetical protein